MLSLTGIVPCRDSVCGRLYRWLVLVVLVALLVYTFFCIIQDRSHPDCRYHDISTACVTFGSFVALLKSGYMEDLVITGRPMANYAEYSGFTIGWRMLMSMRFRLLVFLWFIGVAAKTSHRSLIDECSDSSMISISAIDAIVNAVQVMLVYCQLHICCGLELAVDSFCTRLFCEGTLATAAKAACQWNILQAMVRRAGRYSEVNFLAVNTSVLVQLMLAARVIMNGSLSVTPACAALWAVWLLAPTALAFYTVFQAAALTTKCEHVPSIVNSWSGGEVEHFQERTNLVVYIQNSAAGFYVGGIRLSAGFALKAVYLFAALVFTILSSTLRTV